jgi:hypothetical protein
LATTFDGASVNRRFVAIHNTADKLHYKLRNIYAVERYIYCFNDALHLIKTTQNCWCSKKRKLWVRIKIEAGSYSSIKFYRFMEREKFGRSLSL